VTTASHQKPIAALARAEAELDRFWAKLSFDPALEQRYEAYSSERRNRTLRFWLVFGLVLRLLGLSSELAIGGDMPTYGLAFRVGLLVPVVLVSLWFLSPRYSLATQGVAATAAPILCVVGICFLGSVAPSPHEVRYFFLAGVNIVAINLVMPLRFHHAVVYTAVSIATYLFMAFSGYAGADSWQVIDIVFVYSAAAVASLVVAYRNGIVDRRAFLASEKISAQTSALAHANEELQRLLELDALTGVYNRRYLDLSLKTRGEAAIADHAPLGVIMVDVDHFKIYNDKLGHRAGDDCLRDVAHAIVANVRAGTDIVTRYGGEEFAVLVPGLSLDDTQALGERVRAAIETLDIPHPHAGHAKVTVSVGVAASVPETAEMLDRLINEADAALYRSKHLGRNRVTCATEPESATAEAGERWDSTKSAA
jgi:diguanylate cyclase (GGDEF)-like protein